MDLGDVSRINQLREGTVFNGELIIESRNTQSGLQLKTLRRTTVLGQSMPSREIDFNKPLSRILSDTDKYFAELFPDAIFETHYSVNPSLFGLFPKFSVTALLGPAEKGVARDYDQQDDSLRRYCL